MNTPDKIKGIVNSIKENENGCKEWPFTINHKGYGKTTYENKTCETHRLTYRLFFGEIDEGLQVRHMCHNKKCVNPEHLKLGTPWDNSQDTVKIKGHSRGENHFHSKLNWEKVRHIRKFESNISSKILAEKYGLDRSSILAMLRNKTWKE